MRIELIKIYLSFWIFFIAFKKKMKIQQIFSLKLQQIYKKFIQLLLKF